MLHTWMWSSSSTWGKGCSWPPALKESNSPLALPEEPVLPTPWLKHSKPDLRLPASRTCMRAKSLQSCPTLREPMGCSPWGSSINGILQVRSGLPCSSPGNLPDPGIKPASLRSPALAGGFFAPAPPGKPQEQKIKPSFLKPASSWSFVAVATGNEHVSA